ncbi:putative ATP-dependent RNA helicase DDX46 [Bagarius yarrelli]|uniref:Probable ATP-dependent RNA helicase DDX46 n=1 Tax=Bagarius yarrelli TaxID=175774 RepID=A0A556TX12_BAGYA|nr:putative ATP-dependent RNA helicase DDX46 [Bagarius yarrelli]
MEAESSTPEERGVSAAQRRAEIRRRKLLMNSEQRMNRIVGFNKNDAENNEAQRVTEPRFHLDLDRSDCFSPPVSNKRASPFVSEARSEGSVLDERRDEVEETERGVRLRPRGETSNEERSRSPRRGLNAYLSRFDDAIKLRGQLSNEKTSQENGSDVDEFDPFRLFRLLGSVVLAVCVRVFACHHLSIFAPFLTLELAYMGLYKYFPKKKTGTGNVKRSNKKRFLTVEQFTDSMGRESRRSRSRERKRSRSRERRRSRSRSKGRSKEKNDAGEQSVDKKKKEEKEEEKVEDQDFDQTTLEEEMRKRKERVEKWREEQRKKAMENIGELKKELEEMKQGKKWSLEDDDDDDEEGPTSVDQEGEDDEDKEKEGKMEEAKMTEEGEGEELDPLDAYMEEVKEEVKKFNIGTMKGGNDKKGGMTVTKVVTVVKTKKTPHTTKKKGELMENDQDAMEYSSEEEEVDLQTALTGFQTKQRKVLEPVDHQKIQYESYRKNFYVEVPELAKMTPEEVSEYRLELEGITVKGKGCPKPIKTWVQCGTSMKVLNALKKHNYEKPTPIQTQAIPAIMSGRDLIGIAKTGSGKTIAFLLPMFRHILDQRPLDEGEGPIAVIMTPTRELALQITKECKKFSKPLGLRVVCVYGGTGISEQVSLSVFLFDICTVDLWVTHNAVCKERRRVTNLRRVTYVVVDEADRMFDMGFEPQVMRIVDNVRPDRQTVMFSATFPRAMEALARRILNKPIEVQVGGRSVVCSDVEQHVIMIEEEKKFLKLLEILGHYQEKGSVIIFVDKQEHADGLLKDLMKASYPCMSLHGGIDQYDRDSIINDFKSGACRLMVATSVAARGLDVKQLILVVNYSCPNHYEDYVHRAGRTGRAGNKGYAYTFITEDQGRYAGDIIKALELSGSSVPPELEQLWAKFKEQQKAEGKSIKSSSGFSGKGFKFDETEHALANERKKLQKAALGLHDSDDEDTALDIDEQIESMFNSKKRVKDLAAPGTAPSASGLTVTAAGLGGLAVPSAGNIQKLEIAKKLALKINAQKNLGAEAQDVMQQATNAIMRGGTMIAPSISAKTIAEQLAEKINAKLNYTPIEKLEEERQSAEQSESVKRYEEELEINDFPQTARWKVTSKEALQRIGEYSEAAITIRGTYFPPGKEPKEGERKIYLAIESANELAVQKAKAEITRLIKEELIRLVRSFSHLLLLLLMLLFLLY